MAKSKSIEQILFPILFCFPAINYYIAQVLLAFGAVNPVANIIYMLIYGSGLLAYFIRGNQLAKIVIVATVAIGLIYSCLATEGIWTAISGPVFFQSLFMKLVGMYIPIVLLISTGKERFDNMMLSLLPVVVVVNGLCCIAFVFEILNLGILQEYMTFAYTALPSILIGTYYGFTLKKRALFIISILAAVTVVFGGTRGAFLSLFLFFSLFIVFGIKKTSTRIIVLLISGVILLNLSSLLISGNSFLSGFGYESRIFSMTESGTVAESESRNKVYDKAISIIDYMGHGIYSDRVLLQHINDATYCHNWVLEMLVDFGWILGVIVILFIVIYLYRLVRYRPSGNIHYNFMIFFSMTMLLAKYMFSGSYLDSSECALIAGWFIYCFLNKQYLVNYIFNRLKINELH